MPAGPDTVRGGIGGGLTSGSLAGVVIGAVWGGMRGLYGQPGPVIPFSSLGPIGQRLVRGTAGRLGVQNFGGGGGGGLNVGGTPPISPTGGGYGYPMPSGTETTRGPFRNPWDPYAGLFDILVGAAKRVWKKIPKGAVRKAGRFVPGPAGTAILVGGVLWDFLPDIDGPADEEIARKRTKAGCKPHGAGWVCPPGTYGRSPPRNPAALPPAAPTALPGGAEVPPAAPVITSGPIIRTVKEPWWKRWLEIATPLLPLAALLIPSGGSKKGNVSTTTTISIPSLGPSGFYRDLTGISTRGASLPGSGTGQGRCECKPKRKRKPKDKRRVCYRGTYTETPTGLQKRRGKRISCQRSRKKQRS